MHTSCQKFVDNLAISASVCSEICHQLNRNRHRSSSVVRPPIHLSHYKSQIAAVDVLSLCLCDELVFHFVSLVESQSFFFSFILWRTYQTINFLFQCPIHRVQKKRYQSTFTSPNFTKCYKLFSQFFHQQT